MSRASCDGRIPWVVVTEELSPPRPASPETEALRVWTLDAFLERMADPYWADRGWVRSWRHHGLGRVLG